MNETVTIDGEEWVVLLDDGTDRQLAKIDIEGLRFWRQKYYTGRGWFMSQLACDLPDSLSPTETAALRDMLAPGAVADRRKLAAIAWIVNRISNSTAMGRDHWQAASDAINVIADVLEPK